jgi:protein SCO1
LKPHRYRETQHNAGKPAVKDRAGVLPLWRYPAGDRPVGAAVHFRADGKRAPGRRTPRAPLVRSGRGRLRIGLPGERNLHGLNIPRAGDPAAEACAGFGATRLHRPTVNLAAFRGKAVLVTFVYTHCPDVCPLIVTNLAAAQRELASEARHLQIIAVTVDPKRDTPRAVKGFLATRRATGTMDYLIGSRKQLLPVWKAWGIAVSTNKYEQAEGHTAVVFGITPSGKIA